MIPRITIGTLFIALAVLGCARSHDDSGDGAAAAGCTPVDDAMRAAVEELRSLPCDDPRVFELAALADEIELLPSRCMPSESLAPFVEVGARPAWVGGSVLERTCARVVAADPRSGIEVGAAWEDWAPAFLVPYDAAHVEISIVGISRCGALVRGSRVFRTTAFTGPRELLRTDERIVALASRTGWPGPRPLYATDDRVIDGDETIASVGVRDLGEAASLSMWLEEPSAMRVHHAGEDPSLDHRLEVAPGARHVGWSQDGDARAVIVEGDRVRVVDPWDEEGAIHEERSFAIPTGLRDPVIFGSNLALHGDRGMRVWDLDTGRERDELAGLDGTERMFAAHDRPTLWRRNRALRHEPDYLGSEIPDWEVASAPVDDEIVRAIGSLRSVVQLPFSGLYIAIGEHGFGALHPARTAPYVRPSVALSDVLGGPIRSVIQFQFSHTWVLVDAADGGSVIYDVSSVSGGWDREIDVCWPWDDGV